MTLGLGVCMLATDIDAGGGVARQSYRLLSALAAMGIRPVLIARNYSNRPRRESIGGVLVRRSPVVRRQRVVNSALYLADSVVWLIGNRRRYDVVHAQQMSGPAMAALIGKRFTGRPVLVRVTSCGPDGEVAEVSRMPLADTRRAILRKVDCWVALTSEMKAELERFGVEGSKIVVIPNGTEIPDVAAFSPGVRASARARIGFAGEQLAIYSGRLSSEKGLDTLLTAWRDIERSHRGAQLMLLGGGGAYRNVERDLRDMAREMNLTTVRFEGHVSNVADYLQAADVFVLPSRTEGMSNSLVEAMAAGCTIVATDIPANRELLRHGENALLFPVDNPGCLYETLSVLLTDAERSHSLARAARTQAEVDLSVEAMARSYAQQYERLAAHGPQRG